MLQTKTIKPELLELLTWLMVQDSFSAFALAGGTALALQLGHRNSIDLDLFGKQEIDSDLILNVLSKYGKAEVLAKSQNIVISQVNGVKLDLVNYRYPLLCPVLEAAGIHECCQQWI